MGPLRAFGPRKIAKVLTRELRIARAEGILGYIRYCIFRFSKTKVVRLSRKGNQKRAYISYIPEALIRKDLSYLNAHQNRREMKVIADSFLKQGYDVVVQDYSAPLIKEHNFDVVFGLEPNFTLMAAETPGAIHILYATGAYNKFANHAIRNRTDQFNKKYNCAIPYRRICKEDGCNEVADYILQIGSVFTIETYPVHLRNKITLINQSSNYISPTSIGYSNKDRRHFIWLGSSGTILKGVDLIIPYFIEHPELTIDIIGPLESDVMSVFNLANSPNIRIRGFVDVNSPQFDEIVRDACFLIYPSATEGGAPGAVNVAMKNGIIPLTSRVSSPTQIEQLGHIIATLDRDGIDEAISWTNLLSDDEIAHLCQQARCASKKWTLQNFGHEFSQYLEKKLRKALQ